MPREKERFKKVTEKIKYRNRKTMKEERGLSLRRPVRSVI